MRIGSIFLIFGVLLVVSCRPAPMRYELRREGSNTLLFPPTPAPTAQEIFQIKISHARRQIPTRTDCDIKGDQVSLHWEGRTAEVSLKPETYYAELPSQSSTQAKGGLQVDPLRALDAFQNNLLTLQEKGCLRSDENKRLRRTVVESVPLPPEVAYFLQLGSYDVSGFFDLTSDFRLEVVSPIYAAGGAQTPEHLKGYETDYYSFEGARTSDRLRLSFASAKEVLTGETPVVKDRPQNSVVLPDFPGHYRLLFMREEMPANYVRRAVLLVASDESELRKATPQGQIEAEDFCRRINIPGVSCVAFPANFGVNPELRVRVNEEYDFVPVGGMLFEVLGLQPTAEPPETLRVRRLYRGRLIPVKFAVNAEVLRLVLMPGDEIKY